MKSALITGAGGNLGKAVVKKFIDEGYHVTGTVTHDGEPAAGYDPVKADLTDDKVAAGVVSDVIKKNGHIDVAVLTAGGFAMGKIADTTSTDLLHQYKLNFETAYHIAKPVFAQMMKQGSGRIFLIGSRPGSDMHNSKGMVAYGMAKSLLFRLAELLNDEAKGHDVVTSVVVPSTIDTPQNRESMPDADFTKWVKPETIAGVIYFYCSEEGSALREPVIKVYNNS